MEPVFSHSSYLRVVFPGLWSLCCVGEHTVPALFAKKMYWSTGVFIKQWALLPEKAEQIMLHELTSSLKYQLSTDGFVKHKRTSTYSIVLQYISQNDWNSFQYSQWRKVIKSICVWPLFLYSFPDLWVCWVWVSSLNKSLPCFHSMSSTLKFPAITAHPTLFSLMSVCVMLNPPQRPLDENKH